MPQNRVVLLFGHSHGLQVTSRAEIDACMMNSEVIYLIGVYGNTWAYYGRRDDVRASYSPHDHGCRHLPTWVIAIHSCSL